MARRKKNRGGGGKSFSRTAFKLLRTAALVAPGIIRYGEAPGSPMKRVGTAITGYAGLDGAGRFNTTILAKMWTPFIVTSAVTYIIPKINGLIRKL